MALMVFENFTGQAPLAHLSGLVETTRGRNGQFAKSVIDPNRYPGVLSPFPAGASLTNSSSITTHVTKMVDYISDPSLIFALGANKFYEIVPSSDTVTNTGVFPKTIDGEGTHSGHTTFVGSDMIVYENSDVSSIHEIFISYNDNNDGDIAQFSGVGASEGFDLDYFSTSAGGSVLNKNYPHPLAIGDNNILYIGNGSILSSMDLRTATPTATDTEIDLLGGWIIKSHISHKGFHWIAARETHNVAVAESGIDTRQPGRCAVFVWRYSETTFEEIFFIEDSDIYNIFLHGGELHIMTGSGATSMHLRKFNGAAFPIVPNGEWANNNKIDIGGVSSRYSLIMWGSNFNGEVYTYGSIDPSIRKEFNVIGDIGSSTGAIIQKPLAEDSFYISESNTVRQYKFVEGGGYKTDTALFRTDYRNFPSQAVVKGFRIYFPEMNDAGDSLEILKMEFYKNGSDDLVQIGDISTDESSKGAVYFPFLINDIYSIQLGFRFSGDNISEGDPCILPYRIEVEYELTRKKGT